MLFTEAVKTFFKYILKISFILLWSTNLSIITFQLGGKIITAEKKIILRYLFDENLQILHNMVGY